MNRPRARKSSVTRCAFVVCAMAVIGQVQQAAGQLFDIDRCNSALHAAYDDFLAPYRTATPPALPPGVLVVGGPAGPAELILGPGASTDPYGAIFVINEGRIVVTGSEDPPTKIGAKIILLDQSEFLAWSANIDFQDGAIATDPDGFLDSAGEGVVMFEVGDSASLLMAFSTMSIGQIYPGYLRLVGCGSSNTILAFNDFGPQSEMCGLTQTRKSAEVFPFAFDSATVTVVDEPLAQKTLYEVNAGGNSTINLFDLEFPGAGAYFIVDAEVVNPLDGLVVELADQGHRLLDANGNGPTINAVNSGLLWGFWLEPGAVLTIDNSEVGLWFRPEGDAHLDGIGARMWGAGGSSEVISLPNQPIEVTLTDTLVIETNAYFRAAGTKVLSNAVVGDSNCGGSGLCIVTGSFVSGGGGDFSSVFGSAVTYYDSSTHQMGFFARDNGIAVFHRSLIVSHPENPGPNLFRASDQGLIVFENATFAPPRQYPGSVCTGPDLGEHTCAVADQGAIAQAAIDFPGYGAIIATSQDVLGTAAVRSSTESFWAFDHYDLWADDGLGNVQFIAQGVQSEVAAPTSSLCRTGSDTLGFLDVSTLTPGTYYTLHLTMYNRVGVAMANADNSFVYLP